METHGGKVKTAATRDHYLLCKVPEAWSELPVHKGLQSRAPPCSIAIYKQRRTSKALVYQGYICPPGPQIMPISALKPPSRPETVGQKYEKLLVKMDAEEAEVEATKEIISELRKTRAAESAVRGEVTAGPRTSPGRAEMLLNAVEPEKVLQLETRASRKRRKLNESPSVPLQSTDHVPNYYVPMEIPEGGKRSMSPTPAGGFESCSNPVDFSHLFMEFERAVQEGFFPVDTCVPPEDPEICSS